MKVKVIKRYRDLEKNKIIEVGKTFKVNDERGAVLIAAGVAEAVAETNKADGKQAE